MREEVIKIPPSHHFSTTHKPTHTRLASVYLSVRPASRVCGWRTIVFWLVIRQTARHPGVQSRWFLELDVQLYNYVKRVCDTANYVEVKLNYCFKLIYSFTLFSKGKTRRFINHKSKGLNWLRTVIQFEYFGSPIYFEEFPFEEWAVQLTIMVKAKLKNIKLAPILITKVRSKLYF